jgi:hypothetical protein
MMIKATQPRYDSPKHPCYGADWTGYGLWSGYRPWCWDGLTVWWGPFCDTYSEAFTLAQQHAESRST